MSCKDLLLSKRMPLFRIEEDRSNPEQCTGGVSAFTVGGWSGGRGCQDLQRLDLKDDTSFLTHS